ncbi:ABC transporter permease [Arsenicicoccus sp. oral taxon 190]|nr:ABC transporter permease [Arsenicicoccus sp. oral taxon 190]
MVPRRPRRPGARSGPGIQAGHTTAGWLFTLPMILVLGTFLIVPILMALYVSFTRWGGNGDPFVRANAPLVGLDNYTTLLSGQGLSGRDFMTSIGNTFWYVLLVVPLQTVTALGLALVVNAKGLRGRGFFRTAFYFPSVTSSIAITTVFLFLFSGSGAVNAFLGLFGVHGPTWMSEPAGVLHLALEGLGVQEPGWGRTEVLGRAAWDWLSGPSVAMLVLILLAVWTTTGTFMLMFLAALQDLPEDVDEAAALDGCSPWQKLWWVTIPQLRSAIFLVVTLGLIGTWQVFDQVYATGGGSPGKTLLTPAYLSYDQSFKQGKFGSGAAMAFVVFLIIVVLTWAQRRVMTEREEVGR